MHTNLAHEFPITQNWVYLNHALISPLPRRSLRAETKSKNRLSRVGTQALTTIKRQDSLLKQELSNFLSTPKRNIIFFKNLSDAILFLRHRLPLKSEMGITGIDIPSSQTAAWNIWKSRGLEVELTDQEISCDSDSLDKTALLALGPYLRQQANLFDIGHYAQQCKDSNTLLFADLSFLAGTQQMSPIDLGVDIAIMETHRWMLGLPDIVVMAVSNTVAKALKLREVNTFSGFLGISHNLQNTQNHHSNHMSSFDPSGMFDGLGSFASKAALIASIKLLNNTDLSKIKDRISSIKIQAANGLREEGFDILLSTIPGLLIAKHERMTAQEISEKLVYHDIQVGWEGNNLWISPHFYNTEIEIERFLDATHTIVSQ